MQRTGRICLISTPLSILKASFVTFWYNKQIFCECLLSLRNIFSLSLLINDRAIISWWMVYRSSVLKLTWSEDSSLLFSSISSRSDYISGSCSTKLSSFLLFFSLAFLGTTIFFSKRLNILPVEQLYTQTSRNYDNGVLNGERS